MAGVRLETGRVLVLAGALCLVEHRYLQVKSWVTGLGAITRESTELMCTKSFCRYKSQDVVATGPCRTHILKNFEEHLLIVITRPASHH